MMVGNGELLELMPSLDQERPSVAATLASALKASCQATIILSLRDRPSKRSHYLIGSISGGGSAVAGDITTGANNRGASL